MVARDVPGVEVVVVDYDLTAHESYMRTLLSRTDLLIDATQRLDSTVHVIPNRWVADMPPHAVVLDLSVDPYNFSVSPPIVKGIEGLPQGTLDQFVFQPDDSAYERLDPRVSTENRRVALSCYSWPGRKPRECMEVYGAQLEPFLDVLLNKPADAWDTNSPSLYERALARAELGHWLKARAG
jgi:alanine dehydrogenase